MPTIYACDTCGKTVASLPPGWSTITAVVLMQNPEPAAPTPRDYSYFVCDLHDQSRIPVALHEGLKGLAEA